MHFNLLISYVQKLRDEDFANDPFYTTPPPKPYLFVAKVLKRCGFKRMCV